MNVTWGFINKMQSNLDICSVTVDLFLTAQMGMFCTITKTNDLKI